VFVCSCVSVNFANTAYFPFPFSDMNFLQVYDPNDMQYIEVGVLCVFADVSGDSHSNAKYQKYCNINEYEICVMHLNKNNAIARQL